jgi:hypothetical protein
MSCQEGLRFLARVCARAIPDQNDPAGHMTLHMLDSCDHLVTLDGTFKMMLVDLARHRQSCCRRENPPIPCYSPHNGPFAFACPSCCQGFQVRKAKFVKEYDDCAEPQRLFLSLTSLLTARPLPTLRRARQHVAMASVHCNPSGPILAEGSSGDS